MKTRNLIPAVLSTALFAACGEGFDEDFGYAEGGVPTHNPDDLDSAPAEGDEDGDDESKDAGLEHAPGQIVMPEPTEPNGRITGMAEEDGDLIVYATVGEAVLPYYPSAQEYRIRFDLDGDAVYSELLDVEGVVLERTRNRNGVDSRYFADTVAGEFCFPDPWIVFPKTCLVWPCPWDDDPLPWDCIQITGDDQATQLRGELGGNAFGRDIYQTAEGIEVVDVAGGGLDDVQLARLQAMEVLMSDIGAVLPEVEPLDGECAACVGSGILGAGGAVLCVWGSIAGCEVAGAGYYAWTHGCTHSCN